MSISTRPRAHLIANSNSGKGKGLNLADEARTICDEVGYELVTYEVASAADFDRQSRAAVDAASADGGVVIAAGGDGTIRGVAQAAHGTGVRFAAVPCGTFNYFARTHGIPEDHLEAFRVALTGEARPVRLGQMNDHVFINNASLGLYAKSIRDREAATSKLGRNRLVVVFATIFSLFSQYLLLRVELALEGVTRSLRTPMIFIGNNELQLKDMAMSVAKALEHDNLAVVLLKKLSRIEMVRVIFRGIAKTIESEERLETFGVRELTIRTGRRTELVALDGELLRMPTPLRIRTLPGSLNLVVPRDAQTSGDAPPASAAA